MERREMLKGVVSVVGVGLATGSASASSDTQEWVDIQDPEDLPDVIAYYDERGVPSSHLSEFQDRGYDIFYATDARDIDCDFSLSLKLYPREYNGKRQNGDWGHATGTVSSESRILNFDSPVSTISLTSEGLEAEYASESSSGLVAVNTVDDWPIRELYYNADSVPETHLDGFRRQGMDVISATDIRGRDDAEGRIRLAVTPWNRNTKRTRDVWGVEQEDGGRTLSEEGKLVDVSADVESIELTESAVRVGYES